MNGKIIKIIINLHLKEWIECGMNTTGVPVEPDMADPEASSEGEGLQIWLPINSRVTDTEIKELEIEIGHRLPNDYKTFLKHKHFYQLQISEACFFKHPVNRWKDHFLKEILDGWPPENLLKKGYIPFADWSDWGLLCFDTNRNDSGNNYPKY